MLQIYENKAKIQYKMVEKYYNIAFYLTIKLLKKYYLKQAPFQNILKIFKFRP